MTSAAALVIAACGLPFGLGRASTSQLENGAADNLAKAKSVEAKGTFTQDTTLYKFDTKYVAPATEDVQVTQGSLSYEALQINGKIYFKGSGYLESQITDPTEARQLAKVVGDRWYTSKNAQPVDTSAITDANKVKANFLSTIADKRTDDVVVDGKHVQLEAQEELQLRCGKGSITLTRDGRIVAKGTDIVSRAARSQK